MAPPPTFDMRTLALHHERLRAFVTALMGDEHAAEDALQDVWMRAMRSGPREPGALGAWLRTTAFRVVQNHRRGAARRRLREHGAARDESLPSSAELAERVEFQQRVVDVLQRLPEPHRSLLRDHYFGGLTIAQMARRSGSNVHTVKDRLHRARGVMRRALEREGLGDATSFRWALLGVVPRGLQGPALLGSSLVMKKIVFVLATVVVAASILLWSRGDPRVARVDETLAGSAQRPVELAPLDVEAPALATERIEAPGLGAVEETTPHATLDWVVRGRVGFSDGATGELPRVRVRLDAYDGYEPIGDPFDSTIVESDADATLIWPLSDPERTVTIVATVFDVPGHSARVRESHLAVVGEGPPQGVNVYVAPRDAWVEGIVRASENAPEPGAPIEGARIVYNEAHTVSDARGAYRMAVPSRGYGALIATAEGFRRGGDTPGGLRAGETTEVDLVLEPALGPEGTVFGLVRDERGGVLAGAVVRCGSARDREVVTDVTGRYELHDVELLDDAWIEVVASHDGFAKTSDYVHLERGAAPPEGGTQLDFVLVRGSVVTGRVVDASGTPVRGARIWMGPDPQLVANRRTYSDDVGAFAFESVTPGRTLLGVRKSGQPESVQELIVPEDGAPIDLLVELEASTTLRGEVVDEAGEPIERALVRARRVNDAPLTGGHELGTTGVTDADGSFELEGVPEGEIEVEVWGRGVVRTSTTHDHDGQALTLVAERASAIGGLVVDAETGDPVERFVVRLERPEDESLGPWVSGIDISWIIGGRSFGAVDGRWTSDEKDPFQAGVWTIVVVEADGYELGRIGPVEVGADEDWIHELVRK